MTLSEDEQLYIKACEAYDSEGSYLMSDYDFNRLEQDLIAAGSDLPNKLYSDIAAGDVITISDTDIDDSSHSIKPVYTWAEANSFFSSFPDASFIATLKEDGICTKLSLTSKEMYGQSRNRNNRTAINFSKAVNLAIPKPAVLSPFTVTGESYVPWDDLEHFRETYNVKKYKMPRSAAMSILRTPDKHSVEDVKKLVFTAFNTNKSFATQEDKLKWLKAKGFRVPKYVIFKPDLSKDIREQLLPILAEVDTGAPSDGVVVEVNEKNTLASGNGKYLSTQIALKLEKWDGKVNTGEVVDIDFTSRKGNNGCVLIIKPLPLSDGSTITRVNGYNLGIVHRNKITEGSIIEFARVSNNMCNLIYAQ